MTATATRAPLTEESFSLVALVLRRSPTSRVVRDRAADAVEGDRDDGYRLDRVKINRGRRWVNWHLPVAVLRLSRRSTK